MSDNIKVRKLPKKTLVIIIIMSIIAIVGFLFIQQTKSMKMEEILNTLGHKNVKNVKVINKLNVENRETTVKSTVFKVVFDDIDLKKECVGFVHRSNHGKYSEDIDCK